MVDGSSGNAGSSESGENSQSSGSDPSAEGSSEGSGGSSGSQGGGNPNEESINARNGIENIGTAVFNGSTFVGSLSAKETQCHLIVTNELKSCNISIPDPENENRTMDFFITLDNSPKIDVSIINGTPYITFKVKVNARISSVEITGQGNSDERINIIENSVSQYLKTEIYNYLYKTSKELHSDIDDIGKYALSDFKTMKEFEDYNWLKHYEDAFFKVECEAIVRSGFLLNGGN